MPRLRYIKPECSDDSTMSLDSEKPVSNALLNEKRGDDSSAWGLIRHPHISSLEQWMDLSA